MLAPDVRRVLDGTSIAHSESAEQFRFRPEESVPAVRVLAASLRGW